MSIGRNLLTQSKKLITLVLSVLSAWLLCGQVHSTKRFKQLFNNNFSIFSNLISFPFRFFFLHFCSFLFNFYPRFCLLHFIFSQQDCENVLNVLERNIRTRVRGNKNITHIIIQAKWEECRKKVFLVKKTAAYKKFLSLSSSSAKMNFVLFFYLHPFCSFCSYDCQSCHKTKKKEQERQQQQMVKELWWRMNTTQSWSMEVEEAGHEKWIAIIGRNIIWWWSSLYYSMIEISNGKKWMYHAYFSFIALSFFFFIHSAAPSDIASADVIYS